MEKETVTKFDLEAAFKALDEIEAPIIAKGHGLRANRVNLRERFAAKDAHEVLVEDYYDINDTEDLSAAQEDREAEVAKAKLARIEKIVDLDAETEDDVLPSYIGKYIMQCPQCMTLFYKDEADVETSEENPEVVNINEICQHCGNSSGYTLVGKVGGIDESEAENFETDEVAPEGVEGENELNLDFPEEGTEETDAELPEEEELGEDELNLDDVDLEDIPEEEEETNESIHRSKLLKDIQKKNALKSDIDSEHLTLNEKLELGDDESIIAGDDNDCLCKKKLTSGPLAGYWIYPAYKNGVHQGTIDFEDNDPKQPHDEEAIERWKKKAFSESLADLDEGLFDKFKKSFTWADLKDTHEIRGIKASQLKNGDLICDEIADGIVPEDDDFFGRVTKIVPTEFDDGTPATEIQFGSPAINTVHATNDENDLCYIAVPKVTEDLADWYRKTFDKPASTSTQQAWEDELNGEMGEISDKRRKHLERKFAQQRDWEARHPEETPACPVITPQTAEEPIAVGESMHNSKLLADAEEKSELKTEIESDYLTLNEAYTVKYGRGGEEVEFDSIDAAVTHINQGMKNRSQDHYVLYKDGEELIWIDWYSANEDGSDYNYSVARQSDKNLKFDKHSGITIDIPEENDVAVRGMVVKQLGSMGDIKGAINTGAKLAKFRCVVDNTKPSTLDLENKVIYYNKNEVLPEICKKYIAQMMATSEGLQEDAFDALLDDLWAEPQPTDAEIKATLASFAEELTVDDTNKADNTETAEKADIQEAAFAEAEDFDEKSFNEHLTKYMTEVYSNVNTFETTACNMNQHKLIIEGVIKFNSGKEKATKFIFENTKYGLRGYNSDFSDKRAFKLNIKVADKTLITENFAYRYKIGDAFVKGNTLTEGVKTPN